MDGAKILGYRTVSICLIKCIANVIPEMFLEARAGGEVRVFRDNNYKFYIATLALPIFMCKLKDVVSLVAFHSRF